MNPDTPAKKIQQQRNIEMLREHLAGTSYEELGKRYGLSGQYVGTIIREQIRFWPHFRLPPDIEAKLSPASDTPACAQSPTSGTAPRSR
jgi:hypothetical protein